MKELINEMTTKTRRTLLRELYIVDDSMREKLAQLERKMNDAQEILDNAKSNFEYYENKYARVTTQISEFETAIDY